MHLHFQLLVGLKVHIQKSSLSWEDLMEKLSKIKSGDLTSMRAKRIRSAISSTKLLSVKWSLTITLRKRIMCFKHSEVLVLSGNATSSTLQRLSLSGGNTRTTLISSYMLQRMKEISYLSRALM